MANLSRRLAVLEERFGPVLVEAPRPPVPAGDPRTVEQIADQLFGALYWAEYLQAALDAGAVPATDRDRVRQRIADHRAYAELFDRCGSCKAWPMPSLRFDEDGAVRCGGCGALHDWLPPRTCAYFGHRPDCECDYSCLDELTHTWFWGLIDPRGREWLTGWATR